MKSISAEDHPYCVGGIKWSRLELDWIRERDKQWETRLAAALAAIKAKDKALQELVDLISESSGVYGLHLNGDNSPWSEIEAGGFYERLCFLPEALSTQPDDSALRQYRNSVIEECANAPYLTETAKEAIRELKR